VNPSRKLYPRPSGLSGFLDRAPQLRAGLLQVRAAQRLETQLMDAIPGALRAAIYAIRSNGQRLMIFVTSAEAAHIVRLESATLLRALADKGLKFNEISVSVQSKPSDSSRRETRHAAVNASQLLLNADSIKSERLQTSLRALAKTLADSSKNGAK
jgi:hypothetical protein